MQYAHAFDTAEIGIIECIHTSVLTEWCIRAGQMKAEQSREENSTSQQRVLSTSPAMMRNIVAASQSWPWRLFLMEAES